MNSELRHCEFPGYEFGAFADLVYVLELKYFLVTKDLVRQIFKVCLPYSSAYYFF